MLGDIFTEIKNRLPIEEVAERYGIHIIRGKAICPFHEDNHPSMTFKHNRFRCWACGAGGSVIDFIMLLYGDTPMEAAIRLDHNFSLGLTAEGYTNKSRPERKRAALERQNNQDKVNAFERWRERLIDKLSAHLRKLYRWRDVLTAWSVGLDFSSRLAEIVGGIPLVEYYLDILTFGAFPEQVEFYQVYGKEAERIARQYDFSGEKQLAG